MELRNGSFRYTQLSSIAFRYSRREQLAPRIPNMTACIMKPTCSSRSFGAFLFDNLQILPHFFSPRYTNPRDFVPSMFKQSASALDPI